MPLAGFNVAGFIASPAKGEWRPMNVSGTSPHATPGGPRRADIVVHFPAWSETVAFVGEADGFDNFAAYGVAKIGQTVERFQCSHGVTVAATRFNGGTDHILGGGLWGREN